MKKVIIEYMDNTEETINGADIVSMDSDKSVYYKKIVSPRIENSKINANSEKLRFAKNYDEGFEVCTKVLSKFKDDIETLQKVINGSNPNDIMMYCIGDYIEKEYNSSPILMEKAISFWKKGIEEQHSSKKYGFIHYISHYNKEQRKYPKQYAKKIKKYEPDYVMPK